MRCTAEGKARLPCLGTIGLARIVETPIESAICLIGTPIMKSRKINVLPWVFSSCLADDR